MSTPAVRKPHRLARAGAPLVGDTSFQQTFFKAGNDLLYTAPVTTPALIANATDTVGAFVHLTPPDDGLAAPTGFAYAVACEFDMGVLTQGDDTYDQISIVLQLEARDAAAGAFVALGTGASRLNLQNEAAGVAPDFQYECVALSGLYTGTSQANLASYGADVRATWAFSFGQALTSVQYAEDPGDSYSLRCDWVLVPAP